MAVNMKRRFDGDDSSQEPERKRSAQAYDPLSQCPASGWCGELIRRAYRCLPCRKKKMRCDGNKPTCAHCAKLGTAYSPETFVLTGVCGRVGVWRKPGLQPGYVAQLQNRIGTLIWMRGAYCSGT